MDISGNRENIKQIRNIHKKPITKILSGIIFITLGGILLFFNEGRIIRKKMAIKEGSANVISITASKIDPEHDKKLVHVTGIAGSPVSLKDEDFGIEVNAIHLKRDVEIFQWTEEIKTLDDEKKQGREENKKVSLYKKEWRSGLVSSKNFTDTTGHANPKKVAYSSKWLVADRVTLGKYELDKVFINKIIKESPLSLSHIDLKNTEGNTRVDNNKIYIGKGSENAPEIGDIKIIYTVVNPQEVSVIGKQNKNRIETFITSNKSKIDLLQPGKVSPEKMFAVKVKNRFHIEWFLRFVSFIIIFSGFLLLYKSFIANRGYFSVIKHVTQQGKGKQSFLLTIIVFFLVLGSSWVLYIPFTGTLSYIIASIAAIMLFIKRKKQVINP